MEHFNGKIHKNNITAKLKNVPSFTNKFLTESSNCSLDLNKPILIDDEDIDSVLDLNSTNANYLSSSASPNPSTKTYLLDVGTLKESASKNILQVFVFLSLSIFNFCF